MKAEELRIGNYVQLGKRPKPDQVYKIDFDFKKGHMINGYETEIWTPIPLTEKWLNDLGFEKWTDSEGDKFMRKDKIILTNGFFLRYSDTNDDWYYSTAKKIQYVHQLQNLYYALTGNELTIKTK